MSISLILSGCCIRAHGNALHYLHMVLLVTHHDSLKTAFYWLHTIALGGHASLYLTLQLNGNFQICMALSYNLL